MSAIQIALPKLFDLDSGHKTCLPVNPVFIHVINLACKNGLKKNPSVKYFGICKAL